MKAKREKERKERGDGHGGCEAFGGGEEGG
jgi:hypothetical protein